MNASWRNALRSPEGAVLLTGVGLSILVAVTLVLAAFWSAGMAQLLAAVVATNLVFGRVTAMSLGYATGLDLFSVVMANVVIETVLVLVFYPLLLFSWRQLIEVGRIASFLRSVQGSAERHKEAIRRYGLIGLFLFVWSPIWMTGPVVGCGIGILLGFSMHMTLMAVLSGTYVAILGWALVMGRLHEQVAQFSAWGPLIVLMTLVALAGAAYWIRRRG
jgi:uncharacterized membrane protein